MYNVQFQQSSFSDHQNQYDMSAAALAAATNDKTFPSPITTSPLDSPPNQKNYRQYDLGGYMSNNSNSNNSFSQPISIPQSNNNSMSNNTATSPQQQQGYYGSSNVTENTLSDNAIVSPNSAASVETELIQRK
jgi:hypothetical protein